MAAAAVDTASCVVCWRRQRGVVVSEANYQCVMVWGLRAATHSCTSILPYYLKRQEMEVKREGLADHTSAVFLALDALLLTQSLF